MIFRRLVRRIQRQLLTELALGLVETVEAYETLAGVVVSLRRARVERGDGAKLGERAFVVAGEHEALRGVSVRLRVLRMPRREAREDGGGVRVVCELDERDGVRVGQFRVVGDRVGERLQSLHGL